MKYLLFCLLLIGCTTPRNELSEVRYITKKYIIMKIKDIVVTETRYYYFEGEKYPCEYIVMYDTLGKATAFYRGSAEGFIIYEKKHIKGETLPFEERMLKISLEIDKNNGYIIDKTEDAITDTIRNFYVNKKEKKLLQN
ncbi:hypothetical protein CAPN006_12280 [Capnocytophaga canimorsus]|nr:hypothetical protein CAPN006_12280 [Capnocytophaga canimorsus]